jgi:hypothetical protein
MNFKEMTDDQINKLIAEKLGIHWHIGSIYREPNGKRRLGCSVCGSIEPNPNFCSNAKVLLGELKKKGYWDKFAHQILDLKVIVPVGDYQYENIYHVPLAYILNPRLLCEKYLEWEGKQIFCGKCEAKSENTI